DVGAASGAVAFFRSLGGTTGVSVLGAVLASQVATTVGDGLDRAGVDPASAAAAGSDTLNMQAMPPVVREIVAGAYGSATGDLFLVAMGVAVVGLAVVIFRPRGHLLDTVHMKDAARRQEEPAGAPGPDWAGRTCGAAGAGHASGVVALDLLGGGGVLGGSAGPVGGHRCAGKVVPHREQGAGQSRQGRKVCVRQGCGQAGVLHSDLDA